MTRNRSSAVATWLPTVTLTLVTAATAVGFVRVFDSPSFLVPLLVVAGLGHLLAAATRHLRPGWPTLIMVSAGALVTIDVTHWSVVTSGLPTPFTFDVIGQNLDAAAETLRSASAPVAPEAGLLFAAAVALWVVAWSSDRLSFSYSAPIEALVPSATVFVVVTALAGPDHRWVSAACYGGALALHLLVHRHLTVPTPGASSETAGSRRPIIRGGALATLALVIGLGAAANVPALAPDGLVGLREKNTITVVSPLVDIRSRLVDQSDTELFEVTAGRGEYWRLMALDTFDGEQWSPPNSRVPEADHFLSSAAAHPPSDRIQADFSLTGLGGTYAPAPFRPTYVSDLVDETDRDTSPRLLWDEAYATLIASSATGDVTDLSYTIIADVPQVDSRQVLAAGDDVPPVIRQTFTQLPADFPADLTAEAERIVAGARSPYEKALALQSYFSTANGFGYSTEIPDSLQGEDTNAIRAFLSQKIGFCEQFAGTYAALARAAGLPTRIAVGFTWGRPIDEFADGRQRFLVTGRNAHAWPEVYFAGLGWLPFEPTPGRGNPAAESYTGIPAAQDDPGPDHPDQTPVVPTTTPAQIPSVPTTSPDAPTTTVSPGITPAPAPPSPSGPSPLILGPVSIVVVVLLAGPIIRVSRHRLRRRSADTAARRVRLVWAETLHAWRPLGFRRRDVDTDRDLGDRLARRVKVLLGPDGPGGRAHRLAQLAGAAAWNEAAVTESDVHEAADAAAQLERIARAHRTRWSRLIGWFDPRGPRAT